MPTYITTAFAELNTLVTAIADTVSSIAPPQWILNPNSTPGTNPSTLLLGGRLRAGTQVSSTAYCVDTTPIPVNDYTVQCDFMAVTAPGSGLAGILARFDQVALTGYAFWWNRSTTQWEFQTRRAGVSSGVIASSTVNSLTAGTTRTVRMSVTTVGSTAVISCYVDGTIVIQYPDTNPIAGPGNAGIIFNNAVAGSDATGYQADNFTVNNTAASFSVSPGSIYDGAVSRTLTVTGVNTAWTGATVFSLTTATGCTINSYNVIDGTHATINITTTAGTTGNAVISDGAVSGLLTIATATIAVKPGHILTGQTLRILVQGVNTVWTQDTPTFTVTGGAGSISSRTIIDDRTAIVVLVAGATPATLVIKDPISGTSVTANVSAQAGFAPNDVSIFPSPANWYTSGGNWIASNNTGAYLKFKFSGASLNMNVDISAWLGAQVAAASYPTLTYSVDDGAYTDVLLTASSSSITIASGLAAGTHTCEIWYRRTDPNIEKWAVGTNYETPINTLKITGFVLAAAAVLSAADLRPDVMVGFGDSITAGHSMTATGAVGMDAIGVYLNGVASVYNCEYGQIGFGSQGYGVAGTGGVPGFEDTVLFYWSGRSRVNGSGVFVGTVKYVLENQGTNNRSSVDATLIAAASAVYAVIRTAFPLAKFFKIIPFGQFKAATLTTAYNNWKATTVENGGLINCGPRIAVGLDLTNGGVASKTSVDDVHPDTRTQGRVGAFVTQAMQQSISASTTSGGGGGGYNMPYAYTPTTKNVRVTPGDATAWHLVTGFPGLDPGMSMINSRVRSVAAGGAADGSAFQILTNQTATPADATIGNLISGGDAMGYVLPSGIYSLYVKLTAATDLIEVLVAY